jgi:DNA-binding response OmpR family regulator
MDIAMPELNYLHATARLVAESPTTRVIILSMSVSDEYVRQSFWAGAKGCVVKNVRPSELQRASQPIRCRLCRGGHGKACVGRTKTPDAFSRPMRRVERHTARPPRAETYYQQKRGEGQSHACALRCLGRRWLKIRSEHDILCLIFVIRNSPFAKRYKPA